MGVMKKGHWHSELEAGELATMDDLNTSISPDSNRYHLYISYACPFAHRPQLVHSVLGLDDVISVSSVAAKRYDQGWCFDKDWTDPLFDEDLLSGLFTRTKEDYNGRITVPVLWDHQSSRIVSTESADLAKVLARDFLPLATTPVALYPAALASAIDERCDWLQEHVTSKIYQAGFSQSQATYDEASRILFDSLETLEAILATQQFLVGEQLTLADLFLFPMLIRFDTVYHGLFKLNRRRIQDYPALFGYVKRLLAIPAINATVELDYIKLHYYFSMTHINPSGVVPVGPVIDWSSSQG